MTVREVIARAIETEATGREPDGPSSYGAEADAVLAALSAAGLTIVPTEVYRPQEANQ